MISLVLMEKISLGKVALGLGAAGLAAHVGAEHYKEKEISSHAIGKEIDEIQAKRSAGKLRTIGTGALAGSGILAAKHTMKKDKKQEEQAWT